MEKPCGHFLVFKCKKDVCPVVTYEDFDMSGTCPCCGVLGVQVDE